MPSPARWAAPPCKGGRNTTALYLQLRFALPGAPPHGVEIGEFAILLRFSLSSGGGREEKTSISLRPHSHPETRSARGGSL